jgi:hypothetical protein
MTQSKRYLALAWLALLGNAEAHEWYSGKTDPVLHYDCCGAKTVIP